MKINRQIGKPGYGTHCTPLLAAVLNTTGTVIELGMGDFSTPVLHEAVKHFKNRKLLSFESHKEWLNNFIDLETTWHRIQHVEDFGNIEPLKCSVLLVDHAPALRRIVDIKRFTNFADIICVHDTDKPGYYGYEPLLSGFKYRYDYKRYTKYTTLVSNIFNVNKLFK